MKSQIHSHIFGRNIKPLKMTAEDCADFEQLAKLGICLDAKSLEQQAVNFGLDALEVSVTTPSLSVPIQFAQTFLPGFVPVITAARKIDELIGVTTIGKWEDEEIIQGEIENLGEAELYGDNTNIPLSSWNANWQRRTVLRWEKGFQAGLLEDARNALARINSAAEKRTAAMRALDITRNRVGFFGYNGGNNRTYGLLNDPNLPAYISAAATGVGGSTEWVNKSFKNIVADLTAMFARLRNVSKDVIDVESTATTLVLSTEVHEYINVPTDFGNVTVLQWLRNTYPKVRVMTAPEFNGADGGANVAYLFADSVDDGGSDGGATFIQMIPARFRPLGTERRVKGYVEAFSNASAGVMCKRPYAVQRLTGI